MPKKLKIGVVVSNLIRIPPRPQDLPPAFSGAPEQIASIITEGLVKKGHNVTLFAAGTSKTSAKLFPTSKIPTSIDPKIDFAHHNKAHFQYELLALSLAYKTAARQKFDIIHNHFDYPAAYFAPLISAPTVSTLHSPMDEKRIDLFKAMKDPNHYLVSISDAQRKPLPDANYAATIHHGINAKNIKLNLQPDNYAVLVGRVMPEKGVLEAIELAEQLKFKLVIIGSHGEDPYWLKVKSHVDGKQIVFHEFMPQPEVLKIVSKAKFFLFPLQWEEPFGLVMIEALACGTPVIAYKRGSVPEIVEDGINGFVSTNKAGMIKAIKNIDSIDRATCRRLVEEKFSYQGMIDSYDRVFQKIAASRSK